MRHTAATLLTLASLAALGACSANKSMSLPNAPRDVHSYANPNQVRTRHLDLDLQVDFERRVLEGSATLRVDRGDTGAPLILDTRDLAIQRVETVGGG